MALPPEITARRDQRGSKLGEVIRRLSSSSDGEIIAINKSRTGNKWIPATEADEVKARTPEHFDGFVKPDHVLIRPEAWHQYCDGVAPAELACHFLDRGVLVPANDGSFSKSQQVVRGSGRFYVLRLAALNWCKLVEVHSGAARGAA